MQSVKSEDECIHTEMGDVKGRWMENYEELSNKDNQPDEEATNIPQTPNLDPVPDILKSEVENVVRKLTEEKAPGYMIVLHQRN